MENSVTLTLARYHDLIDIERDFQELVKKEVDGAVKHNSDFLKDALEYNDRLRKDVEQLQKFVFYVLVAFCLVILFIVISRILDQ